MLRSTLSKAKHTTQSKIDQNKILHRIDLAKIALARQLYIVLLQAMNELEFMILVYSKNDCYSFCMDPFASIFEEK